MLPLSLLLQAAAPVAGPVAAPAPWAVQTRTDPVGGATATFAAARSADADAAVTARFVGASGNPAIRQVLEACGYMLGVVPAPTKPAKGK